MIELFTGLTLRRQIISHARCLGGGWETIADELADNAVEIVGNNKPCTNKKDLDSVLQEVFRND